MAIFRDLIKKRLASAFVKDTGTWSDRDAATRVASKSLIDLDMHLIPLSIEGAPLSEMPAELLAQIPVATFQSADGRRRLSIGTHRLDYGFEGFLEAPDVGSWDEFITDAAPRLAAVLEALELSSHRIAFILEEAATDIGGPRSATPRQIAERLLRIPEQAAGDEFTEWSWRLAHRHTHGDEVYNLRPSVSQSKGTSRGTPWEGLSFDYDVNTIPERDDDRFGSETLPAAFGAMLEMANYTDALVADAVGEF